MDKNEFSKILVRWLNKYLKNKYGLYYEICDVFIPETHLSKLNNDYIKSLPNYSIWDFNPDVVGIIKNKTTSEIRLIFLNRSVSALSLKEIGELQCYSRLANVELAMLTSTEGVSSEVNLLLLENNVMKRLLNYDEVSPIIIFSWDVKTGEVNKNTILPLEKRDIFN